MIFSRTPGVFFAVAALTASLSAQSFPAATERSFGELAARVERRQSGDSQQVQIHWFLQSTTNRTGGAGVSESRLMQRRHGMGPLAVERDPQLSEDHLVVVSVDHMGRELDWRLVPDPRLIRGEFPDATGQLTARSFRRAEADLLVDIPDLAETASLRIYEAAWTGTGNGFVLKLVTTAELQ